MRTTFRANDVLALFDKFGDAFKSSAEAKPGTPGEAIKQGLEELKEARAAAILKEGSPAQAAQPATGAPAQPREQLAKAPVAQQQPAATQQPTQPVKTSAEAKATVPQPTTPDARAPQLDRPASPETSRPARDKGTSLGDGSVLHGMGFAPADGTQQKNRAETANVARFLRDPGVPQDQFVPRAWKGVTAKDNATSAFVEIPGRRDRKVDERRAEDRKDEARQGAIADAKKSGEARENRDGRELVKTERELVTTEELRDKHGAAWMQEKVDLEQDPTNDHALRLAESLGELHRCRGLLEDGSRCLRKPMLGIPYCREHAAASAVLTEAPVSIEPPVLAEPDALAGSSIDLSSELLGDPDLHLDTPELPDLEGPPTDPQVAAYVVTD